MAKQTPIKILLKMSRTQTRILLPSILIKKLIALPPMLVIHRNSVFNVVAARQLTIISKDASISLGREFVTSHCFETFRSGRLRTLRNVIIKAGRSVVSVGLGENVFRFDAGDEARVAG